MTRRALEATAPPCKEVGEPILRAELTDTIKLEDRSDFSSNSSPVKKELKDPWREV